LEKKNISDWPKSGPVETGITGPVATPLICLVCYVLNASCICVSAKLVCIIHAAAVADLQYWQHISLVILLSVCSLQINILITVETQQQMTNWQCWIFVGLIKFVVYVVVFTAVKNLFNTSIW